MGVTVKLYKQQAENGRLFIHEHPDSASSCKIPETIELMQSLNISKVVGPMCRYGVHSNDADGKGLVKNLDVVSATLNSSETSSKQSALEGTVMLHVSAEELVPAK